MDLAGNEVDAGQQADSAVALIFVLACERPMRAPLRRQVGSLLRWLGCLVFLVVRDVRNLFARVLSGRGRSFRQMPICGRAGATVNLSPPQKSGISPPAEPCEVGPDIL